MLGPHYRSHSQIIPLSITVNLRDTAPPRVCLRGCRLFVSERLCITSTSQKLNRPRTRNF